MFELVATVLVSADSDKLREKIAREIDAGLREGKAAKRFTVYIWNPTSPILLAAVADSMKHIAHSMFFMQSTIIQDNFPTYGSIISPLYDRMARRRLALVKKGPLVGYVSVPKGREIKSVWFSNNVATFFAKLGNPEFIKGTLESLHKFGFADAEHLGHAVLTKVAAADLPMAWAGFRTDDQDFYRIEIPPVKERFHILTGRLTITDATGATSTCDDLDGGKIVAMSDRKGSCLVSDFSLHFKWWQRAGYAAQEAIRSAFNAASLTVSATLLALSAAAFALGRARRRGRCPGRVERLAVLGVVVSIVAARMVFFAFIDATIFPILDDRHLFASNVLLAPAVFLACYELACGFLAAGTTPVPR
jgi:hypothetical protein